MRRNGEDADDFLWSRTIKKLLLFLTAFIALLAVVAGWIVFNKWEYRTEELEFLGETIRPKWEECASPENWKQYGLDPVVWVSVDGASFQRKPAGYDDDAITENGGAESFNDVVVSTMHYMFQRDRKTILDFQLAISPDGKQVRIGTGLVGSVAMSCLT